jgi:DnaJ family protein C protein 2
VSLPVFCLKQKKSLGSQNLLICCFYLADAAHSREERRWIEKQNKAERARRKKEEMSRLRSLVDAAYACDPRILRFKEEDKQKKLDDKKAKQDAVRARKEEEERVCDATHNVRGDDDMMCVCVYINAPFH